MFKKVLIANRGEIAVRIIRACREMGIKTVAVYSEADRGALHTRLADESICIGPAPGRDSYLNMERILSAIVATKADAIHPGFGFLAENSKFAGLCEKGNITFIGPCAKLIEKMGNKSEARDAMIAAGVPVVLGSKRPVKDVKAASADAKRIGYPVIVKAALGGGGKGMRIVRDENELEEMFNVAQLEAVGAFGDNIMYLEKYIEKPRHVEIQILADKYGNVIHLGERDCSIQRRHQKMIEEAPCAAISEALRKKIGETAVLAAKSVGYEGAGTIEFLLDNDNNFYFMEMNTRIQVEHGITELVTGVDLIKEQICIAAGEKLSYRQKDIKLRGHAIECRINAENPKKNFMPCPGVIHKLHIPGGNGVRIDTAIYSGCSITPFYDSMILKCMVSDRNRTDAIKKMKSVLDELIVEGVSTNLEYLKAIFDDEDFVNGNFDTHFLLEHDIK